MPVSKKAKIQREHRAADKAGTRVPVKANGLPVKAAKPTAICVFCKKEQVTSNLTQLATHANTHADKGWTKEKCWPTVDWSKHVTGAGTGPAANLIAGAVGGASGGQKVLAK